MAPCSSCSGRPATGRWLVCCRPPVVQAQRDHPPIKDLVPAGTLDASGWATVHRQAATALAQGDVSTAESLYVRLLADAATVAGVTVLPGFDPKQINVYRGTAKAGLNLSLDRGDEPGHTGWVDPPARSEYHSTSPGACRLSRPG